jgi:hypothetical protein
VKLPDLTPEQRTLRARIASLSHWAREADRHAATEKARENSPSSLGYWERKVDPDGSMNPRSRANMAEAAMKAHFTRLAYASSRARQLRRAGLMAAGGPE